MDLLTDPYLDELRAMAEREFFARDFYEDAKLGRMPWPTTLNPLAAPFVPSLSPDAGKDGAVGGLSSLHGVGA